MKKIIIKLFSIISVFLFFIFLASCGNIENNTNSSSEVSRIRESSQVNPVFVDEATTAKVVKLEGSATVKDEYEQINCYRGMNVYAGDILEVKNESVMVLKLDNDKYVYFGENTKVNIKTEGKDSKKINIFVEYGKVLAELQNKLGDDEEFFLSSNNSVMAVRGTVFGLNVIKAAKELIQTYSVYKGVTELFVFDKLNNQLISGKITNLSNTKIKIKVPEEKIIPEAEFNEITDNWLKDEDNVYNDEEDANNHLDKVEIEVSDPTKDDYDDVMNKVSETISYSSIEYQAEGYIGIYDGLPHKINVNCDLAGATISYKDENSTEYVSENTFAYTTPGQYRVYYKISCEGYEDKFDYAVIQINKANLNVQYIKEFNPETPIVAGMPLAKALANVDLFEYVSITGVDKDNETIKNSTFDLTGYVSNINTNQEIKINLPESIKDYYKESKIELNIEPLPLSIYSTNIYNNTISLSNITQFNKYNGVLADELFNNIEFYAGNNQILNINNITYAYNQKVEGYIEIKNGKNIINVNLELDDYTLNSDIELTFTDNRTSSYIFIYQEDCLLDEIGSNSYYYQTQGSDDSVILSGNQLIEALGIISSSDVLINFEDDYIMPNKDYSSNLASANFTFNKNKNNIIKFNIIQDTGYTSANLEVNIYFGNEFPTDYPVYEIKNNLNYSLNSNADFVITDNDVLYSFDGINYNETLTFTEFGEFNVYYKIQTGEYIITDYVIVNVDKNKITSPNLSILSDEIAIISNDNYELTFLYQEEIISTELEVDTNGDIITSLDNVYLVYTNLIKNAKYYDNVTEEELNVNIQISPKELNSADFTYIISCDGYDSISGIVEFKNVSFGSTTNSSLSITDVIDLEVPHGNTVSASKPIVSIESNYFVATYYSSNLGSTWSDTKPEFSEVGEYTIYIIYRINPTILDPSFKPSGDSVERLSMNGNYIISIQNIKITE